MEKTKVTLNVLIHEEDKKSAKAMLRKQFELLAERSKLCNPIELCEITKTMVELYTLVHID